MIAFYEVERDPIEHDVITNKPFEDGYYWVEFLDGSTLRLTVRKFAVTSTALGLSYCDTGIKDDAKTEHYSYQVFIPVHNIKRVVMVFNSDDYVSQIMEFRKNCSHMFEEVRTGGVPVQKCAICDFILGVDDA